jgi:hypothetical protein
MWISWFRMGIWKIRGIRRALEEGGRCLYVRMTCFLKCLERMRRRHEFLSSKWLGFNKGLAYIKIMICADITDLSSSWELLHKGRCKWENNLRTVV